jgi:hypothetical protein
MHSTLLDRHYEVKSSNTLQGSDAIIAWPLSTRPNNVGTRLDVGNVCGMA